jgi:L-ribulose-5-phosphate 4-epimerase
MKNHGVFTIGRSAKQATKMAVEVEDIAKITHLAMLRGQPILLTDEQVAEVAELYQYNYGQNRPTHKKTDT